MKNLNFGQALKGMKDGFSVTRLGWNGQGMFLYLVGEGVYPAKTEVAKKYFGKEVKYSSYIAIKAVSGVVSPWVASQTDLLSEDWIII